MAMVISLAIKVLSLTSQLTGFIRARSIQRAPLAILTKLLHSYLATYI